MMKSILLKCQRKKVKWYSDDRFDPYVLTILFYRAGVNWIWYILSILPGYLGCNFQYTPALEKKNFNTLLRVGMNWKIRPLGNLLPSALEIAYFPKHPPLGSVSYSTMVSVFAHVCILVDSVPARGTWLVYRLQMSTEQVGANLLRRH